MRKRIVILVALIIFGILGYNYIYQDHRTIESETPKFELSTEEITLEFIKNAEDAEAKYLNTTIEVTGTISEMDNSSITLDDKVFCQFTNTIQEIGNLSIIKIKGRVIGYDDLLEQVKLDQCIIN